MKRQTTPNRSPAAGPGARRSPFVWGALPLLAALYVAGGGGGSQSDPQAGSGAAGMGGAAVGGSAGSSSCGGVTCGATQVCCGPAECGRCIPAGSKQACPIQCDSVGGAGGVSGAAAAGAAGSAGAGADTGETNEAGASGASSLVECSNRPVTFPTFNRGCGASSDCGAVIHQINCCGTRVVTGVSSSEVARFNVAEQECDDEYPACGCAAGPTMTDTGQVVTGRSAPVECLNGVCTTYEP